MRTFNEKYIKWWNRFFLYVFLLFSTYKRYARTNNTSTSSHPSEQNEVLARKKKNCLHQIFKQKNLIFHNAKVHWTEGSRHRRHVTTTQQTLNPHPTISRSPRIVFHHLWHCARSWRYVCTFLIHSDALLSITNLILKSFLLDCWIVCKSRPRWK